MHNNKILFIVEGNNDEVSFVRCLLDKCYARHPYDLYSYQCNIHVLAQVLHDEYPNFEEDEIDLQLVLKSKEENEDKCTILSQKYRDVFLIFDFDPQHDHPHFDTVERMLAYFSESSNHGKLFINYPMMQSYKHFALLPDDSFETRKVSITECHEYKRIVNDMSNFTDITHYSYKTFVSLMVHHIKKANKILTGNYVIPSCDDYLSWNSAEIYNNQCNEVATDSSVQVLNTSIFLGVDYRPSYFFQMIIRQSCNYDI